MYQKIFNHMKSLHNQGINDDAVLVERTAMELGLDFEEHEDLLFDCSIEILGGNF